MIESQFPPAVRSRLEQCAIVAVLVVDRVEHAVPLAHALLAGGVSAMELTLRTPAAMDALSAVVAEVPDMMAGIGTILTPTQVEDAATAGAVFGVAPGLNRRVIEAAQDRGLPFAPGVATPSEIEAALELDCRDLKFFPAEPCGGLKYLTSMAAPYAHLDVRFIPLGGLNPDCLPAYIQSPLVRAVGGSWLAPRDLILAEDWPAITERAAAARAIIQSVRKAM